MERHLTPCLCIGSNFPLALFCGPCNHVFCSIAQFMTSFLDTHTCVTLSFISPLKVVWTFWYGWLFGKYLQLPQYNIFFNFLDDQAFVVGPQGVHSIWPLVTHLINNPYAGKSCLLHIHIVLKLNVTHVYASKACAPLHNSSNSSISVCKYTSTFVNVINSFPRIIIANIKKIIWLLTNKANYNLIKLQAM